MKKIFDIANVPEEHRLTIQVCLSLAKAAAKGLLWHKFKVRYLYAGKISKMLKWEDERIYGVLDPKYNSWDIAPMMNITAHGDNVPWTRYPDGSAKPVEGAWLNKDPESKEYQEAVAFNYWCKGEHPRSQKSRKAWYRRNGGEYEAYQRGVTLMRPGVDVWSGSKGRRKVDIIHTDGYYCVNVKYRLFGNIYFVSRKGFEVDNVAWRTENTSNWVPVKGKPLKAPVTWSVLFRKIKQ